MNLGMKMLRTVHTFVTAHTLCALQDTRVSYGCCLQSVHLFARFKTMRSKQNLAGALGIQTENWDKHALFRDNKLQFEIKTAIHCFVFYCFLE